MPAAEGIIFGSLWPAAAAAAARGFYLPPSLSLSLRIPISSHTLTNTSAYPYTRVHTGVHMCVCVCTYPVRPLVHALARSCALATDGGGARNFGSIIERSGDRKIPALFRALSPRWGERTSHWPGRLVILARRWAREGVDGLSPLLLLLFSLSHSRSPYLPSLYRAHSSTHPR